MKRPAFVSLSVLILLILLTSHPPVAGGIDKDGPRERANDSAKIPNQTLSRLNKEVIPLLENQQRSAATDILMVLLPKTDATVVDLIDQHLESRGLSAGSALFTDRVLQRVEAGLVDLDKPPTSTELALLVPQLTERIDKLIDRATASPRLNGQEAMPQAWQSIEKFFWDFHVASNELNAHIRLGEFGQTISKRFLQSKSENRDVELVASAERFGPLVERLVKIRQQLIEQEALYRQQQMTQATNQINQANDFRGRFLGMMSLVSARQFFQDFFQAYQPGQLNHPVLAREAFQADITQQIQAAQEPNRELLTKVERLQQGLHWWFRGRYGRGAEAIGLMKSPQAMHSPQAMFGLYMPRQRPEPTPLENRYDAIAAVPDYQRRHYHTWPIGHQQIVKSVYHKTLSTVKTAKYRETTYLNVFW